MFSCESNYLKYKKYGLARFVGMYILTYIVRLEKHTEISEKVGSWDFKQTSPSHIFLDFATFHKVNLLNLEYHSNYQLLHKYFELILLM